MSYLLQDSQQLALLRCKVVVLKGVGFDLFTFGVEHGALSFQFKLEQRLGSVFWRELFFLKGKPTDSRSHFEGNNLQKGAPTWPGRRCARLGSFEPLSGPGQRLVPCLVWGPSIWS